MRPIEEISGNRNRSWSPIGHLHRVADNDELRKVYETCLPKLTAYWTDLGQDETSYAASKSVAQVNMRSWVSPSARSSTMPCAIFAYRVLQHTRAGRDAGAHGAIRRVSGREPSVEPLLRHAGMLVEAPLRAKAENATLVI